MRFVLLLMLIGISSLKAQWLPIEGIPSDNFVYSIYEDGKYLYAGTDSIFYFSKDGGNEWNSTEITSDNVFSINSIVQYESKFIIATMNDRVFVSYDSAKTWVNESEGIIGLGSEQVSKIIIRGDSLFASTMGAKIFVANLKNFPLQWTSYSDGLTNGTYENLTLINNVVYAGGEPNGYLYYNVLGSKSWLSEKFGDIISEPLIMHAIQIRDSITFIVSTQGIHTKSTNGLWKRENISYGFISAGGFVTIKNDLYVYLTRPNKSVWLKWNASEMKWIEQFSTIGKPTYSAIYYNDALLIGTGSGLWYLEDVYLKNDEPTDSPSDFLLEQNYPNPFNPSTTVTITVNKEQSATLAVYNIVGELVTTLHNGVLTSGSHSFAFDASALPSGIYFARLTGELGTQVKKMMYIK